VLSNRSQPRFYHFRWHSDIHLWNDEGSVFTEGYEEAGRAEMVDGEGQAGRAGRPDVEHGGIVDLLLSALPYPLSSLTPPRSQQALCWRLSLYLPLSYRRRLVQDHRL